MNFDEKVELIYAAYERTLDFEIACLRAELTEKEKEKVEKHEGLKLRMQLFDAEIREDLISNMMELSKSENEAIKYRATMSLGQMIYKRRFDSKDDDIDNSKRPNKIELVGID